MQLPLQFLRHKCGTAQSPPSTRPALKAIFTTHAADTSQSNGLSKMAELHKFLVKLLKSDCVSFQQLVLAIRLQSLFQHLLQLQITKPETNYVSSNYFTYIFIQCRIMNLGTAVGIIIINLTTWNNLPNKSGTPKF